MLLFYISLYHDTCLLFMQNCINRKLDTCVDTQTKHRVPSKPLLDQLVDQRWLKFPNHGHVLSFETGSYHQEDDVMDKTHTLAQHNDHSVLLLLLSSCQIHIPSTTRLCNSRIPEECLVCYQMSQRNQVIIKMLYRYL